MNILRHKKWHVRTKENMARVRKDEAKAEEEERQRLERTILAVNERRLQSLRAKADDRMTTMFGKAVEPQSQEDMSVSAETGHVNFFQDLEKEERKNISGGNKEYEEEKKKEQHEWASKVGIQKMLGEGTNELDKKKEWYEQLPALRTGAPKKAEYVPPAVQTALEKIKQAAEEEKSGKKRKHSKKTKKKSKRKRHNSSSSSSSSSSHDSDCSSDDKHKKKKKKKKSRKHQKKRDEEEERRLYLAEKHRQLAILREERLKRECREKSRTDILLNPELAVKKEEPPKKKPKYNSQFNPDLCR